MGRTGGVPEPSGMAWARMRTTGPAGSADGDRAPAPPRTAAPAAGHTLPKLVLVAGRTCRSGEPGVAGRPRFVLR